MDISCGNVQQDEFNSYGGILIRSISDSEKDERYDEGNELIEGPCKVVDKILSLCKVASIAELVPQLSENIFTPGPLYFSKREKKNGKEEKEEKQENKINNSIRVGLTLKKQKNLEYIYKQYRYYNCNNLKKNKCLISLSEYHKNKGEVKTSKLKEWIGHAEKGKEKDNKYFLDNHPDLKTVALQCELFGFLHF